MTTVTLQQRVDAKIKEVIAKAAELYKLDLSTVPVNWNLKGRAAGMASWRGFMGSRSYMVRFNADMARQNPDDMVEDTIPHEYSHIVCFMNPSLGSNHDSGWARVCRALGGTGGRTHDNEVVYGNGRTYEYLVVFKALADILGRVIENKQTHLDMLA